MSEATPIQFQAHCADVNEQDGGTATATFNPGPAVNGVTVNSPFTLTLSDDEAANGAFEAGKDYTFTAAEVQAAAPATTGEGEE